MRGRPRCKMRSNFIAQNFCLRRIWWLRVTLGFRFFRTLARSNGNEKMKKKVRRRKNRERGIAPTENGIVEFAIQIVRRATLFFFLQFLNRICEEKGASVRCCQILQFKGDKFWIDFFIRLNISHSYVLRGGKFNTFEISVPL